MILGVYSNEVHLFPFRTEKLSPLALMVLPFWGWESKSMPLLTKPFPKGAAFFVDTLSWTRNKDGQFVYNEITDGLSKLLVTSRLNLFV